MDGGSFYVSHSSLDAIRPALCELFTSANIAQKKLMQLPIIQEDVQFSQNADPSRGNAIMLSYSNVAAVKSRIQIFSDHIWFPI